MPLVPHYPSDERPRDCRAPDLGDVAERILNGDDGPTPVVA